MRENLAILFAPYTIIMMSKGITDTRSMKNQLFKYSIAILYSGIIVKSYLSVMDNGELIILVSSVEVNKDVDDEETIEKVV